MRKDLEGDSLANEGVLVGNNYSEDRLISDKLSPELRQFDAKVEL